MPRRFFVLRGPALPAAALAFIAAGLLARVLPVGVSALGVWQAGLLLTGTPLVLRSIAGALRGRFAADLVATLAIITAILLVQPLAGLIVVLMQTGGEGLERYAEGRASEAVRGLEAAAPRRAHRLRDGQVEGVAAAELRVGDLVLVRPGELIPCDGVVEAGESAVDASTLTGEPLPVHASEGTLLMSGSVNGEGALHVRATRTSAESRYARIVELVRSAQASKSPIQRVADRYAVWFTPLTLLVCAAAYYISHDPVRVLAVLVVATPCPLILATPIAIIGGINRAARRQIIVRDGGAIERLADVDLVAFDKTGTLTLALPRVASVVATDGSNGPAAGGSASLGRHRAPPRAAAHDVLRHAASLEQASGHLLGRAVVAAAAELGLPLQAPVDVRERPGRGISGRVGAHAVVVGARSLVQELYPELEPALSVADTTANGMRAYVTVDGRLAGTLHFADAPRAGMPRMLQDLRELGVHRTLLLSGDHTGNVHTIARELDIAEAYGDLLPEDKVALVQRALHDGYRVLMVGDGVNDAPALSSATVGIAIAGHGAGITAEAADIVILIDDPTRVVEAIRISQRTLRIAKQSIAAGLGLSLTAMFFAAAGHIPPTVGALLQEGIDVAVIFNALRAAGGGRPSPPPAPHRRARPSPPAPHPARANRPT
jgi:heavy metal translocating P-type ATPase